MIGSLSVAATVTVVTKPVGIGILIDLGEGFWSLERRKAGASVDSIRGQNIPFNSRMIDRTVGLDAVVSHKTTDLRCRSYQKPSSVYALGTSFVRSLVNYTGEVRRDHRKKATYYLFWAVESPESTRTLEWFIPLHGVSEAQEAAVMRVVEYGECRRVAVKIFRAP